MTVSHKPFDEELYEHVEYVLHMLLKKITPSRTPCIYTHTIYWFIFVNGIQRFHVLMGNQLHTIMQSKRGRHSIFNFFSNTQLEKTEVTPKQDQTVNIQMTSFSKTVAL